MRSRLAAAVLSVLLLTGCGGPGAEPEQRTLAVFAAASLVDVFSELERRFEAANPDVDVVVNTGGSSELAQQIVNGARVDLFAAANESTMNLVVDAGLAADGPTVFATNTLQIAIAPGNPRGVTGFADLARPDLTVVTCAPQVPCGAAAERVERASGITLQPVSEEPDVRSALARVTTGNADAALVYTTDVRASGGTVDGVDLTPAEQAAAESRYPIAVLTSGAQPRLANQFRELVIGDTGRKVLTAAGFGVP